MRYYLDTEFIEDGSTVDLVSIGVVSEDGREYYAQSAEFDHHKADEWVKEHVLKQLVMCPHGEPGQKGIAGLYRADKAYHKKYGHCKFDTCPWRTREQIKQDILAFMDSEQHGTPEIWGYYSAYDHIAFCQLFGKMIDLPDGYPMYTHDLIQWADMLGNPQLPLQEDSEHNALADARWNKTVWEFLQEAEKKIRASEFTDAVFKSEFVPLLEDILKKRGKYANNLLQQG
jgi:hypothetical protein